MLTTLLIAALLPAVALMAYVYRKDKVESEPPQLVMRVFLIGAATGLVAGGVESAIIGVMEAALPAGVLLIFLEYFIGVAAVEEACKFFALNTVKNHPEFNYVFDAIVYSVAAALGFAALENVFYVFDGGLETAVVRALFSVPGHMADGVVMGVFYGLARYRELRGNASGARACYLLAYLLPLIEHGFYDAALSLDSDFMSMVAMVFDLAFIAVAFGLIRHVANADEPLHPSLVAPVAQPGAQAPMQETPLQGSRPGSQPGAQSGAWPAARPAAQPTAQSQPQPTPRAQGSLAKHCTQCGAPFSQDAKFCQWCGAPWQ